MEVLQLSDSQRRLNSSSSRSTKLRSRSIDNSWRSPSKLHHYKVKDRYGELERGQ
jgi:hypothetical protein